MVRVCIAGSTCPDMSNTVKPRLPLANSSTEKPTVGTTSVEVDCGGDGRVTAGLGARGGWLARERGDAAPSSV